MSQRPPTFQLITLDFVILDHLADEGTVFGFQALGKQVKSLVKELNEMLPKEAPRLTSGQVQGRLRLLQQMGLTVKVAVQPRTLGWGWQRTKKAKRMLAEQAAKHDGTTVADLEEATT